MYIREYYLPVLKKLSVVIATLNEEKNIADCLKSVKGLADEIIVVDASSQDKTREIAKKWRAKVYKIKNYPIFHKNKQIAVDKAKGEWVLQLDADERISPALASEILSVTSHQSPATSNGYFIPRKNLFLGKFLTKGGQYPDYVIRLFKKGKGEFPCKSVHEQIEVDGAVGYLKNPIIHLADPCFSRYLSRFNRYTTLDAQKLARQKKKPGFLMGFDYFIVKPTVWFLKTYFRHKGFVDGFQGFLFSLFSSLRFPIIYMKFWEVTSESSKGRKSRKGRKR